MGRRKAEPEPVEVEIPERDAQSLRISEVPDNDRRAFLEAIVARLAAETDETHWQRHKEECECYCGMGDHRLLVALVKELRSTLAELETLPVAKGRSKSDELAERRKARIENAAG